MCRQRNLYYWALQADGIERPFSFYFYLAYQVERRGGASVSREKKGKFYVTISYSELGRSEIFVTAFEQSNCEPEIGLRKVFECDDTKLYIRVPRLEGSTTVIITVSVALKYLLDIH